MRPSSRGCSKAADSAGGETIVSPKCTEQIQHRIGQKPAGWADRALALTEVRGQLQALLVHTCCATHCPISAAAKPSTTLTPMLANAQSIWRSSLSRWVSSIQVEKVV